jgi:hypothetical protein
VSDQASKNRGSVVASALALVLMLSAGLGLTLYVKIHDLHMQKTPIYPPGNRQVSAIPSETEHWKRVGSDRISSAEIVETLGTENYVSRDYIRRDTEGTRTPVVIEFHAAYYTGMIDTVPHVPERCFVGGGLQQSSSSRVMELDLDTSSWIPDQSVPEELAGLQGEIYTTRLSNNSAWTDAPGRRVRLPRGVTPESPIKMRISEFFLGEGRKIYAGYFFIANGGTRANADEVRALAFNLSDDYAYYLKVQVNSVTADSFEAFAEQASSLLSDIMGEIMRCTPDWIEVQQGRYPVESQGK